MQVNYLCGHGLEEDLSIHGCILGNALQLTALDVSKVSSHDPQVGHGFRGLLSLKVIRHLVEVVDNL